MNSLDEKSPMWLQGTIWWYGNSDLQPGYVNPGSSESDLVSGKMKEAVIDTIVIQARYMGSTIGLKQSLRANLHKSLSW